MTARSSLLHLASVALVVALLLAGCGTAQSPNTQTNDVQITAEVKAKLATDVNAATVMNIEVNTTNGVVTLAGQVETEEIKRSAETVARSVSGVVDVNNNLQVEASSVAR
jgi:hyperosmotically inducible protein